MAVVYIFAEVVSMADTPLAVFDSLVVTGL